MTLGLSTLAGQKLYHELSNHMPSRESHALGTCLVLDADRTLSPEDSGLIVARAFGVEADVRKIFERHDYDDAAFTEVSLVWSAISQELYVREIERVADSILMRDAWIEVLKAVSSLVPVLVVTAGIPQVWRRVLTNAGHAQIPVIGGCHRSVDRYAISARSKGEIVLALKQRGWKVVAAGDSRVDLAMLAAADRALFVPDHKGSPALRSELHAVPTIRHLLVDQQRFAELPTCTVAGAVEMILQGDL